MRSEKVIGKSLEAKVTVKCTAVAENAGISDSELAAACIVSQASIVDNGGGELEIIVEKADGEKCERCWIYSTNTKDCLCERCAGVVAENC
jgi:isoleucyl-tRNA synthetase